MPSETCSRGQLTLAQLRLLELQSVVQLYRALGGGWQSEFDEDSRSQVRRVLNERGGASTGGCFHSCFCCTSSPSWIASTSASRAWI